MVEGVVDMISGKLSGKRYKVIEAIDRFGVVTTEQLKRYLSDVHFNTIYRARQQGLDLGYIHERVYGMRKLTGITDRGAKLIGKNLKGVSLGNDDMHHQLISNQVLFSFLDEYKDSDVSFQTERDIITEMQFTLPMEELKKPNKMRHIRREIPDFTLIIDGQVIAIEVEISRKTNKRIEEKLKKYKNSNQYDSIFYICGNDYIRKAVGNVNDYLNAGISFLMLDEVIDPEEV